MATYRVARILESTGKFTDEEIRRMTENDAWRWIRENASALSDTLEEWGGGGAGKMMPVTEGGHRTRGH